MSYKPASRLYYIHTSYHNNEIWSNLSPPSAYAAANANPTQAEIDAYIHGGYGSAAAGVETLRGIVREIECKSGRGPFFIRPRSIS